MSRQTSKTETSTTSLPQAPEAASSPYVQFNTAPINTLDGSLARTYSQAHTLIVLSTFFSRFASLVSDPSETLRTGLAVSGILQLVYVVLCLPPTISSATPDNAAPAPVPKAPSKQLRVGKNRAPKVSKDAGAAGRTVPGLLSHFFTLLLATPFFTICLVLFGASVTTDLELTVLTAAHMATLAIMPLVYVHGVDSRRWWEVAALMSPGDEVFGAALGTVVGAWLGAVPIPLDWDRDWQRWPVTIVSGAYAGWAVGKLLGGTLLRGKKLILT